MRPKLWMAAILAAAVIPRPVPAQDKTPRIELGPVFISGKSCGYCDFHEGAGGRVTLNITRNIAGEIESTRQSGGAIFAGGNDDVHTNINLKIMHRMEQRRTLKLFGLNFFGLLGPGFFNQRVTRAHPNPPPFSFRPTISRRETSLSLNFGGGVELIPAKPIAVRFDVDPATFSTPNVFSNPDPMTENRLFLKLAVMLRF